MTSAVGKTTPARETVAVTGSDQTFNPPLRYLYVGTTGNVDMQLVGDSAASVLPNVPVGFIYAEISAIEADGTTATNMVGFR